MGILVSDTPAAAAAVFTTNQVVAAPVIVSREHMRKSRGQMRGLIVNSGNANCCTKQDGYPASVATASKLAAELGDIDPSQILVCSTGVIGAPLRVEKILAAVPHSCADAQRRGRGLRGIRPLDHDHGHAPEMGCGEDAASAASRCASWLRKRLRNDPAEHGDHARIHRHGCRDICRAAFPRAARRRRATFNSITVDGDTSTNDTVAMLANGAVRRARIPTRGGADYKSFFAALESVCKSLALAIVEDGEGAQRVIEIEVRGAPSDRAAEQIARTIANSPLVKTAFAGADPNWGRILAAAGRSGVKFDPERANIWIAGVAVCRRGRENPFDERDVHQKMLAKHVPVRVDLRSGNGVRPHLDLRLHHRIRPHQFQLPHLTRPAARCS